MVFGPAYKDRPGKRRPACTVAGRTIIMGNPAFRLAPEDRPDLVPMAQEPLLPPPSGRKSRTRRRTRRGKLRVGRCSPTPRPRRTRWKAPGADEVPCQPDEPLPNLGATPPNKRLTSLPPTKQRANGLRRRGSAWHVASAFRRALPQKNRRHLRSSLLGRSPQRGPSDRAKPVQRDEKRFFRESLRPLMQAGRWFGSRFCPGGWKFR